MFWLTCVFVAAITSADCLEPYIITGVPADPSTYAEAPAKGWVKRRASCSAPKVDVPTLCSLWQIPATEKGKKLIKAANDGRMQEVQLLLLAGADVDARDSKQNTALHWASWEGYLEVAQYLLDAGAKVGATNWAQNTPLHWAVWGSRPTLVHLLINAKADVNAKNEDGDTPLHFAARDGRIDVARMLLDAGALRKPRNNKGKTPADYARQSNHQYWIDTLKLQ